MEAADNVRYMYAAIKMSEPLYVLDPETVGRYLPSLLYTIRMVYSTSRFYNTHNQLSTFLVKVK